MRTAEGKSLVKLFDTGRRSVPRTSKKIAKNRTMYGCINFIYQRFSFIRGSIHENLNCSFNLLFDNDFACQPSGVDNL